MLQKYIIKKALKRWNLGDFSVRFWDGEEVFVGKNPPKFHIIFNRSLGIGDIKRDLSLTMAECYMNDVVDIQGDYDEIARVLYRFSNRFWLQKHDHVCSRINKQEEASNIKAHYDLGNDFYRLWLDTTMSYSCAYFKTPNDTLYAAQTNKIEHTLKKLDLKPNENLLDIGCGWGYLAIRAAQEYDVNVLGITISKEQYKKATQMVKELKLEHKIEIRLQNYQDLSMNEYFDKLVSVGMFEHVGKENLPLYFMKAKQVLKSGGIFLLHSILSAFEGKTNAFIDKYIFPGGYLPSLREVVSVMSECDFHLLLAESLRLHYAKTLWDWYENFKGEIDEVRKMYDDRFIRMWSLYLKSCAAAFRVGSVDIYQLLLSKEVNNNIPWTQEYIYKD